MINWSSQKCGSKYTYAFRMCYWCLHTVCPESRFSYPHKQNWKSTIFLIRYKSDFYISHCQIYTICSTKFTFFSFLCDLCQGWLVDFAKFAPLCELEDFAELGSILVSTSLIVLMVILKLVLTCAYIIHWPLDEVARDPPLIPRHFFFFESFRVTKSTNINHMHSNHRHKVRFQHIVYLKLNKWRDKILKNTGLNKQNSPWGVKLIRKQEIILFIHYVIRKQESILFLHRVTEFLAEAEKIEDAKMS